MKDYLLEVKELTTCFYSGDIEIPAVKSVSFNVSKGETLCIVGESGSGKSVTSLSIMRLIPEPPGKIVDGQIIFKGKDLLKISNEEMRKIRGNRIAMIFQEPMTSLNPVFTIGKQLSESIILHKKLSKKVAMEVAFEMLKQVKIPLPEKRLKQYPHQLSGGMRQRVMIAMALSCSPDLLIADEPTTALDVTIQAQILQLIKELKENIGTAMLLITHNMGVVAEVADNVLVMYGGRVQEYTDVKTLFKDPKHPYTAGLLKSIPKTEGPRTKLFTIEGSVPMPGQIKVGCQFYTRCHLATSRCQAEEPPLIKVGKSLVRCWEYE
ncbi:ABC transporter ATP-binding protein [Bacillaceae bacterium IKA-2]|nr:ABC transporter ATP-binding protein [Bacillaceae bacterium IKA-2]